MADPDPGLEERDIYYSYEEDRSWEHIDENEFEASIIRFYDCVEARELEADNSEELAREEFEQVSLPVDLTDYVVVRLELISTIEQVQGNYI